MAFKIQISEKGKTYSFSTEDESLVGKKLGEEIKGEEVKPELAGYTLKLTGASDKSGFPSLEQVEGTGKKRILLNRGKGQRAKGKGLILRKTIRGNTISTEMVQINLNVIKKGHKPLEELFPKAEKKEGTA